MESKTLKLRENILRKPEVGATLLGLDLRYFIRMFHQEITKKNFVFKPFHLTIIRALENLVYNPTEKKNLLIAIPPRWGKSAIVRYAVAWFYCINRNCNNIYTSYSDILVLKFSEEIRRVMKSMNGI